MSFSTLFLRLWIPLSLPAFGSTTCLWSRTTSSRSKNVAGSLYGIFCTPSFHHMHQTLLRLHSSHRQDQKVYCNSPLRGSVQQLSSPGHRNTDVVTPDALTLISQPAQFENPDLSTSFDSRTSKPAPFQGWSTAI